MILFLAATASFIFHAHDSHAHSKKIYIYQLGIIIYGNVPFDIIKTNFFRAARTHSHHRYGHSFLMLRICGFYRFWKIDSINYSASSSFGSVHSSHIRGKLFVSNNLLNKLYR